MEEYNRNTKYILIRYITNQSYNLHLSSFRPRHENYIGAGLLKSEMMMMMRMVVIRSNIKSINERCFY